MPKPLALNMHLKSNLYSVATVSLTTVPVRILLHIHMQVRRLQECVLARRSGGHHRPGGVAAQVGSVRCRKRPQIFLAGEPFIFKGIPAGKENERHSHSRPLLFLQGFHLVLSAQTAHDHRLLRHVQEHQHFRVRPYSRPGMGSRKNRLL